MIKQPDNMGCFFLLITNKTTNLAACNLNYTNGRDAQRVV